MNELFDKFILRIIFILLIALALLAYKYAHLLLYPIPQKFRTKFYPAKNPADTLHLFSRIIGTGIIFSEFYLHIYNGIFIALFDFIIKAALTFSFYIIALYVIESIVLYRTEYREEIVNRKNISYAIISSAHAIGMAFIIKISTSVAKDSALIFLFLWLFSLVLIGLSIKTLQILSKINTEKMSFQRNLSSALSYTGYFSGSAIMTCATINHNLNDIKWYSINVVLKILLCLIILPIFIKSINWIYKIEHSSPSDNALTKTKDDAHSDIGNGIFEGVSFCTACVLTVVVTKHLDVGMLYPIF